MPLRQTTLDLGQARGAARLEGARTPKRTEQESESDSDHECDVDDVVRERTRRRPRDLLKKEKKALSWLNAFQNIASLQIREQATEVSHYHGHPVLDQHSSRPKGQEELLSVRGWRNRPIHVAFMDALL